MTKILLPIFLFLSHSLFGQIVQEEWFADDAQWVLDVSPWGPGDPSFWKIAVTGDTLIGDKQCKILREVFSKDTAAVISNQIYAIVYEENYVAYHLDYNGDFVKIYDLNLFEGEELVYENYISGCDKAVFRLMERGIEDFGTYQLGYQLFYPYCEDSGNHLFWDRLDFNDYDTIRESWTKVYYGIGFVENRTSLGYNGPMPNLIFGKIWVDPPSDFNCYVDGDISYPYPCYQYAETRKDTNIIKGLVYWDENQNEQLDSFEIGLPNVRVNLNYYLHFEPDIEYWTYTDENGVFTLKGHLGRNNITPQIIGNKDDCWRFPSSSSTKHLDINIGETLFLYFGYQNLPSEFTQTQVRITSAPTRCGFTVPYTLSIENNGCQPVKGQYGLVLNELVQFIEATPAPNEIIGDTLLWDYETLSSNQIAAVQLNLQIAGTDFLGETINMTGLAYFEDDLGTRQLNSTYDYQSEIRCAYDPNDKLVAPNRLNKFDQNYTLFEEALEYTIRFQNTGNDTAFNVVLEDQLDENLDWATFQPILASHPYEVVLQKAGLLKFSFPNILLPDSTTNEPASHGFISYKIKALDSLADNTLIENSANIFFDFNPPILTNTVQNVMVEALPKTTNTKHLSFDNQLVVFPNPFDNWLSFQWKGDAVLPIKKIRLFDATGKIVQEWNDSAIARVIPINFLPNGIYFYQVLGTQGELIGSNKIIKY